MCFSNEPLSLSLWFQRIAIVATGEPGTVENSLRHAGHLVQLTPIPFRKVVPPLFDEGAFEALLDAGDFDTAARQLFVPPTTVFIETSSDDSPLRAVVACALLRRSVEGSGATAAAAILDAWAKWLTTLRLEFGSDLENDPAPVGSAPYPICQSACPGGA